MDKFQIRDNRPGPEYVVRYEALTNRATRRKAARLARRQGLTIEHHTTNEPYRRPFRDKPGKHLARLAELEDAGQLHGRAVIQLDELPAHLAP